MEEFSIGDLIKGHQQGFTDLEISNAIRFVTGEVTRVGAAGKVVITITMKPQKTQEGDNVLLAIDHVATAPKPSASPSLYFIGEDGQPTKRSPRQPLANGDVALPHFEREV